MDPVYQKHFGLVREPFNNTPDPSFLYLSAGHKEALAQLVYGIKARKGFVVLTGEVGTGKTTVVHALLRELNGNTQTALIFNTIASPKDLLRYVCEDFGLIGSQAEPRDMHGHLTLVNQFLLDSYGKGNNVALIIDEAQNLSAEVLESIRLLSNFETSQDKLLQILMVGQPELAGRLNSPGLRQLKQRVTLRHHLRPLNFAECNDYVATRLQIAGGSLSLFTPKALETVYLYSGGVPRLVNILCDNGLLTAYGLGKKKVDAAMVREIAEDLNLTVGERLAALPKPAALTAVRKKKPTTETPVAETRSWGSLVLFVVAWFLLVGGMVYLVGSWNDFSFFREGLVSEFIENFYKGLRYEQSF